MDERDVLCYAMLCHAELAGLRGNCIDDGHGYDGAPSAGDEWRETWWSIARTPHHTTPHHTTPHHTALHCTAHDIDGWMRWMRNATDSKRHSMIHTYIQYDANASPSAARTSCM